MRVIRFVAIFAAVAAIVTVAAVTAAFMVWSMMSVQPGTATALFTLFILAPGAGLAAGLYFAARSAMRTGGGTGPRDGQGAQGPAILLAIFAGLAGFLAGYGGTRAWIDLNYTDRWSNPAAAPVWIPHAPAFAGAALALVLAALVLAGRRGSARR
ncbi:hypothetical protein [Phreatobacter sp.]|uniref:hypothetical protein n=1 Tax=Phreatobacter sp. TaxID=1966341 RepID=UPI0025CC56DD|nr:hypothetical protein [Phreatobacter sp.]